MTDVRDRLEVLWERHRDVFLVGSGVVAGVLVTSVVAFVLWCARPGVGAEAGSVGQEAVARSVVSVDGAGDPPVLRVRDVIAGAAPSSGVSHGASGDVAGGWSISPFGSYEVSLPSGFALWGVEYDSESRCLTYGTVESGDGAVDARRVVQFYDEGAVGSYGIDRSGVRRLWRMRSGRAAAVVDGSGGTRVVVVDDGDTDIALSYAVPYDPESDADGSWGEVVCDVCGCEAESAADALDDVMVAVAERTWGV